MVEGISRDLSGEELKESVAYIVRMTLTSNFDLAFVYTISGRPRWC